jgi:uncharacterized membrane protein
MYITLKKITKGIWHRHMSEEEIVAWKGFLLGINIAVLIIGPIATLALIFIFGKYTVLDENMVTMITNWFK